MASHRQAIEQVLVNHEYADGYGFNRDGEAWMLRDFSGVTLYSIRGPW